MHPGTCIANRALIRWDGAGPQISRRRSLFFLAQVRKKQGARKEGQVRIGRFCTAGSQKRGLQVQEGRFCTAGGLKRGLQVQEARFCTTGSQKRERQVWNENRGFCEDDA
jgi:hypothetical protein